MKKIKLYLMSVQSVKKSPFHKIENLKVETINL